MSAEWVHGALDLDHPTSKPNSTFHYLLTVSSSLNLSLSLSPLLQNGNKNRTISRLLWGVNEFKWVKCLEQCQFPYKFLVNTSYGFWWVCKDKLRLLLRFGYENWRANEIIVRCWAEIRKFLPDRWKISIFYAGGKEMALRGWQFEDTEKREISWWDTITEKMREDGNQRRGRWMDEPRRGGTSCFLRQGLGGVIRRGKAKDAYLCGWGAESWRQSRRIKAFSLWSRNRLIWWEKKGGRSEEWQKTDKWRSYIVATSRNKMTLARM